MNNKVNLFLFLTIFLSNSLSYSTLKLAKVSPFDKNHPYSKDKDLIPLT